MTSIVSLLTTPGNGVVYDDVIVRSYETGPSIARQRGAELCSLADRGGLLSIPPGNLRDVANTLLALADANDRVEG